MSKGAAERNNLVAIELHIAKAEERITELFAEGDLTPSQNEALLREEILLDCLYEQRQIILENRRTKHIHLVVTR